MRNYLAPIAPWKNVRWVLNKLDMVNKRQQKGCRHIYHIDTAAGRKGYQINIKRGVSMKKFFFITPEGLSFKPNMDSPEPDALELEIFGFNKNITFHDAIQNLIELNENPDSNRFIRPFSLRIENDNRKNIWMREKRYKNSMAS